MTANGYVLNEQYPFVNPELINTTCTYPEKWGTLY